MAVQSLPTLNSRGLPLSAGAVQRQRLRRLPLVRDFHEALDDANLWPLRPVNMRVLQINVGKLCNQACRHCHVDAGPDRREVMTRETMEDCVAVIERSDIPVVDITGGAPELNPNFRWLVQECRRLGRHVIDRCNLTILESPSHRDLPEFFRENGVEVVCSLPHYRALGTDRQRGQGVFDKSVSALRRLNRVGYGDSVSGLRLVLVTNPVGAFMSGSQASMEVEWKRELLRVHGIRFDSLYTLTNLPISRYLDWLLESENLKSYMHQLVAAFNPCAAARVMCRDTLSVGWDGTLYDCDFNQMLEMPIRQGSPRHIRDFDQAALEARTIEVDRHCFGCAAGAGASCGGATAP